MFALCTAFDNSTKKSVIEFRRIRKVKLSQFLRFSTFTRIHPPPFIVFSSYFILRHVLTNLKNVSQFYFHFPSIPFPLQLLYIYFTSNSPHWLNNSFFEKARKAKCTQQCENIICSHHFLIYSIEFGQLWLGYRLYTHINLITFYYCYMPLKISKSKKDIKSHA